MGRMTAEEKIYGLWWEYLKRSKIYAAICDMWATPFEYEKVPKSLNPVKIYQYRYKAYCLSKGEEPEERSDEDWQLIFRNYRLFGNIFEREFDEWWNVKSTMKDRVTKRKPHVVDMRDAMFYHKVFRIEALCTSYQVPDGDESPNPQKLLEDIASAKSHIFLAVPVIGDINMEEISSEISKIRDKYKNDESVKDADAELKIMTLPTTRIRYDDLEMYMKVYDLRKKGIAMTEVIKMIAPRDDSTNVIVQRKFYRFQRKAENIIENVATGLFPGKY